MSIMQPGKVVGKVFLTQPDSPERNLRMVVDDEEAYEEQLLLDPSPEPSVSPSETYFQCWRCSFKTNDKDGFYSHYLQAHDGCPTPFYSRQRRSRKSLTPKLSPIKSVKLQLYENKENQKSDTTIHDDAERNECLSSNWLLNLTSGNRCIDCGMYYPNILRHIKETHLNLDNLPPSSNFSIFPEKRVPVACGEEDTVVIISEEVQDMDVFSQHHLLTKIESKEENIKQWKVETRSPDESQVIVTHEDILGPDGADVNDAHEYYTIDEQGRLVRLHPDELQLTNEEGNSLITVTEESLGQGSDQGVSPVTRGSTHDGSSSFHSVKEVKRQFSSEEPFTTTSTPSIEGSSAGAQSVRSKHCT